MREYHEKEYYEKLNKKDKKVFDSLYIKYEGNEFKVLKVMNFRKKLGIINITSSLAIVLPLFLNLPIIILILGLFVEVISWTYYFIYKNTEVNTLLAIIISFVLSIIISSIIYNILMSIISNILTSIIYSILFSY